MGKEGESPKTFPCQVGMPCPAMPGVKLLGAISGPSLGEP